MQYRCENEISIFELCDRHLGHSREDESKSEAMHHYPEKGIFSASFGNDINTIENFVVQ